MQALRLDQHILLHSYRIFQDFMERADDCLRKKQWNAAAAYAQMAAHHASWHHSGLWASPQLEAILRAIGRVAGQKKHQPGIGGRRNYTPNRVLHVLTEAYGIGGHTRLAWRWIEKDSVRSHSVALVHQGSTTVPRPLADAVRMAGGEIYFLDKKLGGLLERAEALQELAAGFDLIALHVHPFDVVPVIAFTDKQKFPPVIFMNHADHVFWVGVGISDVVAHIRDSGMVVSQLRRGFAKNRCAILPIPVVAPTRELSHAQAKKNLGLAEDSTVLLSIAAAHKYEPIFGETTFVDALLPVLKEHKKAVLVVLGPENHGQWLRGMEDLPGRIKVYGNREDLAAFYQAADIYLDSFPVASLTSLLEAGSYGIPLVTYSPFIEDAAVLGADCPGFSETLLRARDLESYRAEISRLLEDPQFRVRLGNETKAEILKMHAGENWQRFLENLYHCADMLPCQTAQPEQMDEARIEYVDFRLAALRSDPSMARTAEEILYCHLGLLPLSTRLKLWASTFDARPTLLPHCLLSEWARGSVRNWISSQRRLLVPVAHR